jgi:periplasmic protein TonB
MRTGARGIEWPEDIFRRWALSAVLAISVHAAIVTALLRHPDLALADSGSDAVLMELAPVPVSPTVTPVDLAAGALQLQLASEERAKAEPDRKPETVADDKVQVPPQVVHAPVTLPTAEPIAQPKEAPVLSPMQTANAAQPEQSAPPIAVQPAVQAAAPAPGQTLGPSSQAIATWQRQLAVHLQKFKRYPQNAKGAQGTATISFAVDRAGRVTEIRLIQSSGSAALDDEAIANVKRAEPFPQSPANATQSQLSFTVPIRYVTSAR